MLKQSYDYRKNLVIRLTYVETIEVLTYSQLRKNTPYSIGLEHEPLNLKSVALTTTPR